MSSLGKAGVAAAKWSAASTAARFALQIVGQVVLARLLGPENYGLFGIGMVVFTFSNFLAGFGFGWSLLQRVDLSDEDIRFAFTWQVLVGAVAMAAMYFSAPMLAGYFHEPRVRPVIEWLSLACVISAATATASNLLQRALDFRMVGLIQVGSYVLGYIAVGIPMAWLGYGVETLIAAWLTQASVTMLASLAMSRHSVRPLFWCPGATAILGTGSLVFLANIVNWLLNNLDRVVIGRLLNAQAVGLYSAAYNLATLPNAVLLSALQPAFLAVGAHLQDEPRRLGQAYLDILATVWVLILPLFVFLSLVSGDIVRVLYGPQWAEAASVLAILLLAMPAYVSWGLSTPILWNTGRKHYEFVLQIPLVGIGVLGYGFFAGRGAVAAAVVAASLLALRAIVVGGAAFRALDLKAMAIVPEVGRGLALSLLCVFAALAGRYAVASFALPLLSLLVSGLTTAGLLVCAVMLQPRLLGDRAIDMVIRFAPSLAGPLKWSLPECTMPRGAEVRLEE